MGHLTQREVTAGRLLFALVLVCSLSVYNSINAQVLGDPIDVSRDFWKMENIYFIGNRVTGFDSATGLGSLEWARHVRHTSLSFNKIDVGLTRGRSTEFPAPSMMKTLLCLFPYPSSVPEPFGSGLRHALRP